VEQRPVTRKLAAILAADVAGYSRLMGADEDGTLAQLKAHRRTLVDPKIKGHRGKIIKTTDARAAAWPRCPSPAAMVTRGALRVRREIERLHGSAERRLRGVEHPVHVRRQPGRHVPIIRFR
jgi:class 3 adenylate cyclase